MHEYEDEEEEDVLAPKEPQVSSNDPAERKAARMLRIIRRKEAIKRAEQPPEEAAAEEEPSLTEQATAAAAMELQRLALDGAAKVTNVKVTTDEREVFRRGIFSERMNNTLERIEQEVKDTQAEYDEVAANWDAMLALKDPLDIDTAINEQRVKCDELLQSKDEVIEEIKAFLQSTDDAYYEDLDKQDQDIKELSDRVEKQVSLMQRAFEAQLSLIEHAITIEREAMLEHNNKRWEALYKQRDKEELAHMDAKEEQLEKHKEEIEKIMWDHHDKYRTAKIELETLLQELQKELEKMKAICLINTEKIGYNYQVLKKREEENVFVRSQQKRKLNKMSDIANDLRAKIRKAALDGVQEEIRADAEIVKLMQGMDDLEKKSYHFSYVNNYKFCQVWLMSTAQCGNLARELWHAEAALHAHVLSEPPPPQPSLPTKSPIKCNKEVNGVNVEEKESNPCKLEISDPNNQLEKDAKDRLTRHILNLVADNTGFLIEDRLFTLIAPYQEDSRNLCTLDAIFMALEIQAEEDIHLLCETFSKYAFCPICIGLDSTSENFENSLSTQDDALSRAASFTTKGTQRAERASMRGRSVGGRSISASTSRSLHVGSHRQDVSRSDHLLLSEAEQIIHRVCEPPVEFGAALVTSELSSGQKKHGAGARNIMVTIDTDTKTNLIKSSYLCPLGHSLEIEPMQVLTALGEFVSVFVPPEKKKLNDILENLKPPDFSSASRQLKAEDITKYWAQWKNVFTVEKDRFWDNVLHGLNTYLTTLQERERLHDEVVILRQRNAALRRMVRGALPDLPAPAPKYTRPGPPALLVPFSTGGGTAMRLPRLGNDKGPTEPPVRGPRAQQCCGLPIRATRDYACP